MWGVWWLLEWGANLAFKSIHFSFKELYFLLPHSISIKDHSSYSINQWQLSREKTYDVQMVAMRRGFFLLGLMDLISPLLCLVMQSKAVTPESSLWLVD